MKKALLTKISAAALILLTVLSMTACEPEEMDYLIMKSAVGNSAYYPNIGLVIDINPIDIEYDDFVIQWQVSSGSVYSFDSEMNLIEIDASIDGSPITLFSDDNYGSVIWVPDENTGSEATVDIYLYKDYDSSSPFAHDSTEIKAVNTGYEVQ